MENLKTIVLIDSVKKYLKISRKRKKNKKTFVGFQKLKQAPVRQLKIKGQEDLNFHKQPH